MDCRDQTILIGSTAPLLVLIMSFLGFAIVTPVFLDRFRLFSVIFATLPFRRHLLDLDTQGDVAGFNRLNPQPKADTRNQARDLTGSGELHRDFYSSRAGRLQSDRCPVRRWGSSASPPPRHGDERVPAVHQKSPAKIAKPDNSHVRWIHLTPS